MFITKGTLRYSRNLPDRDQWCLVVDCDPEIVKYYIALAKQDRIILNRPKFDTHITVIRREELLLNKEKWGFRNEEQIDIQIKHTYSFPAKDGIKKEIFCLDIQCDLLHDLRELFGLKREYPFHITLGWR